MALTFRRGRVFTLGGGMLDSRLHPEPAAHLRGERDDLRPLVGELTLPSIP